MYSRIKYKLTIKVPGTKLLADFLFHSKEELDGFLQLNQLKPFTIQHVLLRDEGGVPRDPVSSH